MSVSVRKRPVTSLIAAVLTLALAGCAGESKDDSIDATGSNPFAQQHVTEEPTAEPTEEPGEDPTDESTQGPSYDVGDCDVIDAETIAAITGRAFEDVTPVFEFDGSGYKCTWDAADRSATVAVSVLEGRAEAVEASLEDLRVDFPDLQDETIPGADIAFSIEAGQAVGMTLGADYLQVAFFSDGTDEAAFTLELASEVARNF